MNCASNLIRQYPKSRPAQPPYTTMSNLILGSPYYMEFARPRQQAVLEACISGRGRVWQGASCHAPSIQEDVSEQKRAKPDELLARLLGADKEADVDGLWETVAANLAANRLRLLLGADEIPDPPGEGG